MAARLQVEWSVSAQFPDGCCNLPRDSTSDVSCGSCRDYDDKASARCRSWQRYDAFTPCMRCWSLAVVRGPGGRAGNKRNLEGAHKRLCCLVLCNGPCAPKRSIVVLVMRPAGALDTSTNRSDMLHHTSCRKHPTLLQLVALSKLSDNVN